MARLRCLSGKARKGVAWAATGNASTESFGSHRMGSTIIGTHSVSELYFTMTHFTKSGGSFSIWLATYSETEDFVGYYVEELDRRPTLVYFQVGRVAMLRPSEEPEVIPNITEEAGIPERNTYYEPLADSKK